MSSELFYNILWWWAGTGLLAFLFLNFITAPYGRHSKASWGTQIPNRIAWVLMEFPSLLVFILCFTLGPAELDPLTWIFFALYVSHYTNRSVIYPWRTRTSGKKMPLVVALMAVCFNTMNGFLNGYWFSAFAPGYGWEWLGSLPFITGMILYIGGGALNWYSDQVLLGLRRGGKKGYFIPYGGPFRWVSCPNFLGEIIQWTGFAVMTWSPAALVFALWTVFNLLPRALDHHRWYKKSFPDYPPERKALIPGLL